MAEDERELLDEMIALNQRHKKEYESKKHSKIVAVPTSSSISPSRPGHPRVTQSPIGYSTQVNQNTMISLNNKNASSLSAQVQPSLQQSKGASLQGKQLIKVPRGGQQQTKALEESPQQLGVVTNGQTLQNYTRQSPVDLPSSSTTSKQSNSQTNIGGSPRNQSGHSGLTNEVR